ncbi:MAG: DUF1269 domain-containing protein [Ilumatobacteraceae bacterium]
MAREVDTMPQTLVGISFNDAFRAQEFMTATARLAANKSLVMHDAVVVRKDNDGKTHVVETVDPSVGRSATSGALWASFLGLLVGGPVGWIAGGVIGAGAGAITAKVVDLGVPDEWVDWFKNAVAPNTTTVVLLLTDVTINDFVAETERFVGAELLYANLDQLSFDRITSALAGSDVATPAGTVETPLSGPPTGEPAI